MVAPTGEYGATTHYSPETTKGVVMPSSIKQPAVNGARRLRTRNLVQKAVLMVLASYANPDGTNAFPSIGRLADDLGCDERTVKRALAALREDGLIERAGITPSGTWNHTIHLEGAPQRGDTPGTDQAPQAPRGGSTAGTPTNPVTKPKTNPNPQTPGFRSSTKETANPRTDEGTKRGKGLITHQCNLFGFESCGAKPGEPCKNKDENRFHDARHESKRTTDKKIKDGWVEVEPGSGRWRRPNTLAADIARMQRVVTG